MPSKEKKILAPRRIAIAFGGGGGKGAYHIGCWKALRELGLEKNVVAVSGASVGALNAVLFAQGDLQTAKDIWTSISPKRVYKRPFLRILLAVFGRLATYGILSLGYAFFLLSLLSLLFLGVALIANSADTNTACGIFLISMLATFILTVVGSFVRNFLNRHMTLFSDRPLRSLVASKVNIDQLRTRDLKVYVTAATFRSVLDPYSDSPLFPNFDQLKRAFRGTSDRAFGVVWKEVNRLDVLYSKSPAETINRIEREAQRHGKAAGLLGFTRAVPEYIELHQLSSDEAINYLVQSCALPEIFPARMVKMIRYIDGGVADNLPVIPLLQESVDVVLAINLDHRCALDGIEKKIKQITRDIHYSKLSPQKAWILFREWVLRGIKGEEAQTTAGLEKIILLRPSRSLGNILTGTLNFSRTKAERDLRLGYEDTLRVFNLTYSWVARQARSESELLL